MRLSTLIASLFAVQILAFPFEACKGDEGRKPDGSRGNKPGGVGGDGGGAGAGGGRRNASHPTNGSTPMNGQHRNVLYVTNWSIYGAGYNPDNIPIDKITHVLYAFADILPNGTV